MDDLLKSILGGASAEQKGAGATEDPLSQLLGGGSGNPLQDILGAVLGGGAAPQGSAGRGAQSPISGQDALSGILGGILGGGAQGGTQQAQDPLGGILGAILGGGRTGVGANSFLAPIANALAERLNLNPAVAQAIVMFAVTKLLPSLLGGGNASGAAAPSRSRRQKPASGGLDLDSLLSTMGRSQSAGARYLRKSGVADELAGYVGIDQDTAVQSLQQVFSMLGGQTSPAPKKRGRLVRRRRNGTAD
jgi:hypothetical protein